MMALTVTLVGLYDDGSNVTEPARITKRVLFTEDHTLAELMSIREACRNARSAYGTFLFEVEIAQYTITDEASS